MSLALRALIRRVTQDVSVANPGVGKWYFGFLVPSTGYNWAFETQLIPVSVGTLGE